METIETHSGMNVEIISGQIVDVNIIHLGVFIIFVVCWMAILGVFIVKFLEWTDKFINSDRVRK